MAALFVLLVSGACGSSATFKNYTMPAVLDGHCRLLPTGQLDDLFGARRSGLPQRGEATIRLTRQDVAGDLPLAGLVARRARTAALAMLAGGIELDALVVDREGRIVGRSGA